MFAAAWATIACLLASGGSQPVAAQGYTVPTPTISVLSPRGIRFEIVELNAGVSLIAYHYSINVDVPGIQAGLWNIDVTPQDGYFVHENQLVTVNNGDTVYYWVYAVYNTVGYHLLNKQWTYRVSTSSLPPGTAGTRSTSVVPVSAAAPTAGLTEGFSTTDAIILGVVLGVAVVLAAVLSVIFVLRFRRNSGRPSPEHSNPPVDKQQEALPEVAPARPLSDGQSHMYEYVDETYSRGSAQGRSPAESAWPETVLPRRTEALTEQRAGSRPPPPLPQDASRASATPATDNYYIRLIKE